jgi:protein-S-isoprenylcysteine O-methyltransferase Ste14
MTTTAVLASSGLCFASFAWGMVWHFRKEGKPSRAMLVTVLLASFSLTLQIVALGRRRILLPIPALALYGASLVLFWWAVSVTRRRLAACGQGSISPELVTAGPYRYIRHPFYTSYNLAWAAGFVATAWWPLAVAAAVMAALYDRAAREEECGFAASSLHESYRQYRSRTGRYFPRLFQ